MKGLCRLALAALFVAACGGETATGPNSRNALLKEPSGPVLATGVDSSTGATIITNADDYLPGEVVHVTGHGWAAGETVNLHMTDDNDATVDVDTNVVADAQGDFSVHYYDVQPHDLGATFTLTATGATSGSVAVATFTDGRAVTSATINGLTAVTVGPSASLSINAIGALTGASNNTLGSIGVSVYVDGSLPATAVALSPCYDVNPDEGPSSPSNNIPFNHTFTVTGPAGVNVYDVIITTYSDNACATTQGAAAFTMQNAITVGNVNVATTTTLTASPSPSVFGQSVTFTAAVTPNTGSSTPTGTVTFYKKSANGETCSALGSASQVGTDNTQSDGFTYSTSALAVGTHGFLACYAANSGWSDSGDDVDHTVNQAGSATTIDSDNPDPSSNGQNVAFVVSVAAVSPGAGTPTGTVSLYKVNAGDNCSTVGIVLLGSGSLASGTVTINYSGLALGSHLVLACYGGDASFSGSSDTETHDVALIETTTDISSSNPTTVTGENTTFTATVTRTVGGAAVTTGSISFKTGGTSCSNATALAGPFTPDVNGQATTTKSFNASQSPLVVRACYTEGTTYAGSEDDVTQTINKAQSTLSLATNTPTYYGNSATFTATIGVSSPGAGSPTGTVRFYNGGTCNTSTGLGSGTLLASGSISGTTAQGSISTLNANTYTIVACYGDGADFLGSEDSDSHVVNPAVTQVLLEDTPASTAFGASVNFKATVTLEAGKGAGSPTGSVKFYLNNACSGTLLGTDNSATTSTNQSEFDIDVTSASLDVSGSPHTITACFDNTDGNFTDSSDDEQHTITAATSATSIAVSPTSQQYSDSVVFTATITPASVLGSTQTGTVQFKVGGTNTGAAQAITCGATECTATLRYKITAQASPPTLAISASFTSTNSNFANSASVTDAILTVTVENAVVFNEAVAPSNIAIGNGGTLTFSIKELNPESNVGGLAGAGDLTNIGPSNVVVSAQGILYPSNQINFTCNRSFGGSANTYTHVINYSCTFPAVNTADTYDVSIDITGNYYDGAGAALIQVTDPNAGFTTGGGWYWHNGVVGGEKVNFGFMAKATVNNKKTNYQGSLLVIRHKANGDIIKVKSNVFEGYSIGATSNNCTPATFSGKATYSLNGTSQGNFAFTGYAVDCGEPGTADKFGLYQAYTPTAGNEIGTSTTASGLAASVKTIVGGNIQVPQPGGR